MLREGLRKTTYKNVKIIMNGRIHPAYMDAV